MEVGEGFLVLDGFVEQFHKSHQCSPDRSSRFPFATPSNRRFYFLVPYAHGAPLKCPDYSTLLRGPNLTTIKKRARWLRHAH